ncbi:hypothetical protein BJ170DRAFT_678812 [Xylariales sp. AK1849]|nr:hypothetical protein BJ170DRAFT_678812 [Xylariales sp. AK1849]
MKFARGSILGFSFLAGSFAQPLEPRDGFQAVHLTFHGGPASYELTIPADGQVYPTSNSIAVDIIDAPDRYGTDCMRK